MSGRNGRAGGAPRVTASVIAWNDEDHLRRCLASLAAQTHPSIRVVVVDNASRDGSAEAARRARPDALIIRAAENLGYAGAHNLAFAACGTPYFLVLNADVVLEPDYVARLVEAMEDDPGLGAVSGTLLQAGAAVGPRVVDSAGIAPDWRGRFRDVGTGETAAAPPGAGCREVFGVCGAAALYRREAILDAVPDPAGRPFDPAFFAYYEDADLAWALRRRGWRAGIVGRAAAAHVRGGSGAPSRKVEALLHRNSLWVLAKHARPGELARLAPGWLLFEGMKLLQSFFTKPWLAQAGRARRRGLRAMIDRRRALGRNARRARRAPAARLQRIERALRDAQAASYDAIADGPYHAVVESAACLERVDPRPGERVLDLGCGTGRLLAPLGARGARVVGADFSRASLLLARRKAPDALLVQADATRLPFRDASFDRALSNQMIHHLPDAPGRRAVVREAARVLRKEGELVLTAYNDAPLRRAFSAAEGRHPGGIYYRRFRAGEIRRLLEEAFEVIAMTGIRHLPARSVGERLMHRRLFRWLPRLDRRLEGSFLSPRLAHLWILQGRRKPAGGDAPEEGPA